MQPTSALQPFHLRSSARQQRTLGTNTNNDHQQPANKHLVPQPPTRTDKTPSWPHQPRPQPPSLTDVASQPNSLTRPTRRMARVGCHGVHGCTAQEHPSRCTAPYSEHSPLSLHHDSARTPLPHLRHRTLRLTLARPDGRPRGRWSAIVLVSAAGRAPAPGACGVPPPLFPSSSVAQEPRSSRSNSPASRRRGRDAVLGPLRESSPRRSDGDARGRACTRVDEARSTAPPGRLNARHKGRAMSSCSSPSAAGRDAVRALVVYLVLSPHSFPARLWPKNRARPAPTRPPPQSESPASPRGGQDAVLGPLRASRVRRSDGRACT
ncbi:hypothetical protein B0H10DRAFT_2193266 [Mycena sp. CBHHK59/15]|nr:hypothetical protein B0H10DRAFT_2193266 [Mycena sp. CBHHK59/15]